MLPAPVSPSLESAARAMCEPESDDDDPFEDEDSRFTTEAVDEDNLHDALNDHCAWREGDGLSVASDENSGDGAACTQFPHRG